jgi:hypothetical protein
MTAPSTNPAAPKRKIFDKEMVITIAVLAALLGGLTTFLVHRHQQNDAKAAASLQSDKQRFAQMEKDMQTAYAALTAGLEKPLTEQKDSKTCGYTSQKYSKGDLYCSIGYGVAYSLPNYDAEIDRLAAMAGKLDGTVFKPDQQQLKNAMEDKQSTGYQQEQNIEISLKVNDNFSCNLYSKSTKEDQNGNTITDGRIATYAFSCSKNLNKPIYPLAK